MWYFRITEANAGFVALLNDGVRPQVVDEDGNIQYFITYEDERPNEICSHSPSNASHVRTSAYVELLSEPPVSHAEQGLRYSLAGFTRALVKPT